MALPPVELVIQAYNELFIYTAAFFFWGILGTVLIIMLFMQTPAWTFFRCKFGRRNVIVNPAENGYLSFFSGKPFGRFSVRKEGKNNIFYATNPSDRYTESKSKVPCFINYSKFAFSLKPQAALIAEALRNEGIRNWEDLQIFLEGIKEKDGKEPNEVSLKIKGQDVIFSEIVDIFNKGLAKYGDKKDFMEWSLSIGGQSVDFDNIDMMYGENQRGDIIEAEIQRRGAAEAARRGGMGGDMAKLIIVAAVAVFIILIGVMVVMSAIDSGAIGGGNEQQTAPTTAPPTGVSIIPLAGTGISTE